MDDPARPGIDRLPTLTEVLELGREHEAAAAPLTDAASEPAAAQAAPPDAGALVALVLAALEPQLGAWLDARLHAALAPALARAAEGLIRDAREELALTLRELVEESVAQALRQDQPR